MFLKLFEPRESVKDKTSPPQLFVMPHGMLDPWFQNDPSRRVKAIRNSIYWKLVEHKTIETANCILFTCQKELELARQPFRPYRPQGEANVGLGVALPPPFNESMQEAFNQRVSLAKDQSYFLFLSRIHPKKGVDLLIRAYEQCST